MRQSTCRCVRGGCGWYDWAGDRVKTKAECENATVYLRVGFPCWSGGLMAGWKHAGSTPACRTPPTHILSAFQTMWTCRPPTNPTPATNPHNHPPPHPSLQRIPNDVDLPPIVPATLVKPTLPANLRPLPDEQQSLFTSVVPDTRSVAWFCMCVWGLFLAVVEVCIAYSSWRNLYTHTPFYDMPSAHTHLILLRTVHSQGLPKHSDMLPRTPLPCHQQTHKPSAPFNCSAKVLLKDSDLAGSLVLSLKQQTPHPSPGPLQRQSPVQVLGYGGLPGAHLHAQAQRRQRRRTHPPARVGAA